jgi:hypothetical protein
VIPGLAGQGIEVHLLQLEVDGAGELEDFFVEVQQVVVGALNSLDQLDSGGSIFKFESQRF